MDGILLINKPKGYTSHDVVSLVRKKMNKIKVGHTGTLDPNATGVLPVLIGQATKISKYLIEHDKTYIAELKLGEKRSTGDIEGEIIETKNVPTLEDTRIKKVLKSFEGKQKQTPPIYSAIKINGKKAYEYARENKEIFLEPRDIEIYSIDLLEYEDDIVRFKVSCSKGTYIRTLCENIANGLGTVGFMLNLERTQINEQFFINDAIELGNIIEADAKEIEKKLISIETVFNTYPEISLTPEEKKLFLNGVKIQQNLSDNVYRVYNKTEFIGLGVIKDNILKRDVVIRKSEVREWYLDKIDKFAKLCKICYNINSMANMPLHIDLIPFPLVFAILAYIFLQEGGNWKWITKP